jgi:hypothetical protein
MLKKIALLAIVCHPVLSFAFFCPTNFSQIDFGQTPDQITQICGKPNNQKEYTKENENVPQEWSYFVPQTLTLKNNNQQMPGTYKMTVAFNAQGKAINISVNGIGVGSTPICSRPIQIGDSRETIKAACGDPGLANRQTNTLAAPEDIKVVEYTYTNVSPAITLVFENGVLTEKK